GEEGNGGTIKITGGTVIANGSGAGAGVGGGISGGSGAITIGGNAHVTAVGGDKISNSYLTTDSNGIIRIGGNAVVNATGGGGMVDDNYQVFITGGTVTAIGSSGIGGSGIGGGGVGAGGAVTITGGMVTAAGHTGIGGGAGYKGAGAAVTISGQRTSVTATGVQYANDVGSSRYNNNGGSLSVTDGATLEMTGIGTNAASQEYKNCTLIDKDGILTHYGENGTKIAEKPEITSQPQDQTTYVGGVVTLSVAAHIADGGTLSYQWYSLNNVAAIQRIPGATSDSYTVPTEVVGDIDYCVEVTNTNHNDTATTESYWAKVTVKALTNAETPDITQQPRGGTYMQNEIATLTVAASVTDGGILSYQWYSNATDSNTGGTEIPGATSASYTAPTGTTGTTYYYIVVTNTNNRATGQKTATSTSNVAAVTVTGNSSGGGGGGGGGGGTYTPPALKDSYTSGGNQIGQSVSRSDLQRLIDSGKSLTMQSDTVKMTFDPTALKAILAAVPATAGNISFAAAPADISAYPEAAQLIGARPAYSFNVSYQDSNGDSVTANVNFPAGSASIALNHLPAAGEATASLFVVYVDGSGTVTWLDMSSYADGKMLADVPHFSIYGVAYKTSVPVFADIEGHWAKEDMEFVAARKLLSGTGNNLFSPDSTMTRGMFVTALYRLAGTPQVSGEGGAFGDVSADAYYANAVKWAAQKKIVNGTSATTFSPDAAVTREQMAVIMTNYAEQMGYSIPTPLKEAAFADSGAISAWVTKEVSAMQRAGIIQAKDGNRFDPQGNATRAEGSAVLHRFVETIIEPAMATGWVKNDSGHWLYYLDGKALSDWQNIGRLRYYFGVDGVMHEGWKREDATGKWYFYTSSGASTGWKEIDGKWYYFFEDGAMAVDTKVDGYEVGPDGARKES
uniref:S-layer homology domain-containing protein n=1 Tax=Clostridium sp. AM58-1XD TaxID=2292307 RepID=UPI000EE8E785